MSAIHAERLPWVKCLKDQAPRNRDLMDSFRTFIALVAAELATALGGPRREEDYLAAVRGWSSEDLWRFKEPLHTLVDDMGRHPYTDIIGPAYELFEGRGNKARTGSFYTPDSLSALVARLTLAGGLTWPERGPLVIHEPAGGSGGMLLRLVEYLRDHLGAPPQSFRVQTWDINRLACDMAYINLTLHGVPAEIVWGDTLRYAPQRVWRNIWHFAAHGWDGPAQKGVL